MVRHSRSHLVLDLASISAISAVLRVDDLGQPLEAKRLNRRTYTYLRLVLRIDLGQPLEVERRNRRALVAAITVDAHQAVGHLMVKVRLRLWAI